MKEKKRDPRWLAAAALLVCAVVLLGCWWRVLREGQAPANDPPLVLCTVLLVALGGSMAALLAQSERRKQEEVAQRDALLAFASAETHTVLALWDGRSQCLRYVTPNVQAQLGLSADAVQQDPSLFGRWAIDPDQWRAFDTLDRLKPGQREQYKLELMNPETKVRAPYRVTLFRPAPPQADTLVLALCDLTQERALHQSVADALTTAENASRSKSMFLSNMDHEIRAPMQSLAALTERMTHALEEPDVLADTLDALRETTLHLEESITDILDMSKIESGSASLDVAPLCLAQLLQALDADARRLAQTRKQSFRLQAVNIRHENILADGARLRQILWNLLSNALQYTPEGGEIRFAVKELPRRSPQYARYNFTVSDNGVGMSQEFLEHIFEPFTREESSETSAVPGTGLGLAIARNLAEQMGGSIHVDSELNRGSQFEVLLEFPVDQEADDAIDPLRILLMGCDPDLSASILTAAAHRPVTVRRAVGLAHAMAFLNKEPADVILAPLPERRGVMGNAIYQLHDTQPTPCPLVFFLTDRPREDAEYLVAEAHADGIVLLPFFFSSLVAEVARAEAENAKPLPPHRSKLVGMHFLCAEDNARQAQRLRDLLTAAGATCTLCSDGRKALKTFQAAGPKEYDAIFMDVQMPWMSGYDAALAIRTGNHPAAKTIPIFAMTANADGDDVYTSPLRYGITGYLSKPVDPRVLETMVLQHCTPVAYRPPDHIVDIPLPPRP